MGVVGQEKHLQGSVLMVLPGPVRLFTLTGNYYIHLMTTTVVLLNMSHISVDLWRGKNTHVEFVFMYFYMFVFIVQDMIYLAVQNSSKQKMTFAFFLTGEITQVLESIPWVRCSTGNLYIHVCVFYNSSSSPLRPSSSVTRPECSEGV